MDARAGLRCVEFWQPSTKKWLQAHAQDHYVTLRVLIEAGNGLITIEETTGSDGKPDLVFKLDYSKIDSVGRPALASFLQKLQVRDSQPRL